MVEELEHSSLYLSITGFIVIETLGSDSIDFIDEDDCWSFFLCQSKGIADHLWSISDIHLDQI